ncbi:MAG: hypothetical protein ACLT1A_05640 [Dysosmobacter sp.]
MAENILEVHDLEIRYVTDEETVQAVNDITFSLERGESIGLVGRPVPERPPRPLESWGWCRIRQERS